MSIVLKICKFFFQVGPTSKIMKFIGRKVIRSIFTAKNFTFQIFACKECVCSFPSTAVVWRYSSVTHRPYLVFETNQMLVRYWHLKLKNQNFQIFFCFTDWYRPILDKYGYYKLWNDTQLIFLLHLIFVSLYLRSSNLHTNSNDYW